jgi:hypothetical protein
METQAEQIERFAALVLEQHRARLRADYPGSGMDERARVNVKPRTLYTLVDVGDEVSMSGKYMVEHATGTIFGIHGYGKVNKRHQYGTLATVTEWNWGGYTARQVTR